MYAPLYNRLSGWVFVGSGLCGVFVSRFADYFHFSSAETILNLCIGMAALMGARSRERYAVLAAVSCGLFLFVWGIWGIAWPTSAFGTAEPLETLIRLLAGAWGMYVAVQDVLVWRRL